MSTVHELTQDDMDTVWNFKDCEVCSYPDLIRLNVATFSIHQDGGSSLIPQKILEHTSLTITQSYLHMSNRAYDRFICLVQPEQRHCSLKSMRTRLRGLSVLK